MEPLIVTESGTYGNFYGQFIVVNWYQDQRPGKLNEFTETRLMEQRSPAIRCRQHVSEIDLNELPSCLFGLETLRCCNTVNCRNRCVYIVSAEL